MTNLKLGDNALAFSLPGVDGNTYALSDYADRSVVAVIFSCNHCPYVLAWEDRMIQIQADYAARGVQFVAINANNAVTYPADSFDNMVVHAQQKSFNFPYLHDESQAVARAYGAERTPEVFVFDKGGVLRYHGRIDDNYDDPDAVQQHYLRDALDAVLGGESPQIASTPPTGCTIKWKN